MSVDARVMRFVVHETHSLCNPLGLSLGPNADEVAMAARFPISGSPKDAYACFRIP